MWPSQGDPNFGLTLGDLNFCQLGVIPIWVNLGWSQFGLTCGDSNFGQHGVISIWVKLGNPVGLGWPIRGDPNLGQLGAILIWICLINFGWYQWGQLGLIPFRWVIDLSGLVFMNWQLHMSLFNVPRI